MIDILKTECACEKCSFMCHSPCCGTPEDIGLLMKAGYTDRLMLDDLEGGEDMIKPALKGFEGRRSPWATSSKEGCTFWKDGKCELHDLGLKPIQGKLAHHSLTVRQNDKIGEYINNSWETEEAKQVIRDWKDEQNFCTP